MVEVELIAVRVDVQSNTPVVLLQESGGLHRTLPIFVGAPEATAIAYAIQHIDTPRPMTHDLMADLIGAVGITVERVVITELVDRTYYAELHLHTPQGRVVVSSRPSDAVALAARTEAPIFAADELMDAVGVILAPDEDGDEEDVPEELVGQFQRFLDTVKPEDFGSS